MRFSVPVWILTGVLSALPMAALAQTPYVGGNYTALEYTDPNNAGSDLDPTAAYLRLGFEPNPYIGLEARGGFGISSDKRDNVELEQDSFHGGYLTLGAPVNQAFRPYVIGGYTKSRYHVRTSTTTLFGTSSSEETRTREDESWGLGFDLTLSRHVALNLEYMRYLDKQKLELSGFSLGFRSAF